MIHRTAIHILKTPLLITFLIMTPELSDLAGEIEMGTYQTWLCFKMSSSNRDRSFPRQILRGILLDSVAHHSQNIKFYGFRLQL